MTTGGTSGHDNALPINSKPGCIMPEPFDRIERGEKTPSLGTLMALSKALDVTMAELFGDTLTDGDLTVIRVQDRVSLPGDPLYQIEAILPAKEERPFAVYVIKPGPEFFNHDLSDHSGFESVFVLSGSIELEIADRRLTLFEGDCASFDAHIVHRLRSCDGRSAAALVIIARHP